MILPISFRVVAFCLDSYFSESADMPLAQSGFLQHYRKPLNCSWRMAPMPGAR
jgi:hypothetical protein